MSLTAMMLRQAASRWPAGCATLRRGFIRATLGGIWLHASRMIVWTAGAAAWGIKQCAPLHFISCDQACDHAVMAVHRCTFHEGKLQGPDCQQKADVAEAEEGIDGFQRVTVHTPRSVLGNQCQPAQL